jgi:type 1 glutamine amidotransferase
MARRALLTAVITASLVLPLGPARSQEAAHRVLVFSRTTGFRHDSIPDGIAAVRSIGQQEGFEVQATEDPSVFADDRLAGFDAVVFLLTTGDVLDDSQQAAFQRYIGRGGGFVGVHSASDTEHAWPWYGELVGAFFVGHPAIQGASVFVTDRVHASTRDLPERWDRTDEWYNFDANPRPKVHVLARLDESTYSGGAMGSDHPISWCRFFDGGRTWYTAMGHTRESYSEALFVSHLAGGIRFAAGYPDCDSPAARPRALPPRS